MMVCLASNLVTMVKLAGRRPKVGFVVWKLNVSFAGFDVRYTSLKVLVFICDISIKVVNSSLQHVLLILRGTLLKYRLYCNCLSRQKWSILPRFPSLKSFYMVYVKILKMRNFILKFYTWRFYNRCKYFSTRFTCR